MISRALMIAGCCLLLSGCASGWSCEGWTKISPSRVDTGGTKSQVLAHNNFGRRQGCWK